MDNVKNYNITVTDDELDMLICGLSAQISDYCCSQEEKEPYYELLNKLQRL